MKPVFGDKFVNTYAGENNPHKVGIFVRKIRRTGRMNPGEWYEMTDGKGDFWETKPGNLIPHPESSKPESPMSNTSQQVNPLDKFREQAIHAYIQLPANVHWAGSPDFFDALAAAAEAYGRELVVAELERVDQYQLNPCSSHDHCECQNDDKRPELPDDYFEQRKRAFQDPKTINDDKE